MSEQYKNEPGETPAQEHRTDESDQQTRQGPQDGPKFEKAPDPLAGVRKGAENILARMEGKSVSMKTYVGTIVAVVVLMLLARCGS